MTISSRGGASQKSVHPYIDVSPSVASNQDWCGWYFRSFESKANQANEAEMFKKLITNDKTLFASAILFFISGLIWGYWQRNFMCFARSGALIVAIGLFFLARASVIGEDLKLNVRSSETELSLLDPAHYKKLGQAVPDWVRKDQESRRAVGVYGPVVSLIGTLVWGFGDLLTDFFF